MYQSFLHGCGPYCLSIIVASGKVGLTKKKFEKNDFDFHCSGAKHLAEARIHMSVFVYNKVSYVRILIGFRL